jgi:hypothetical protein
MSSARGSEGNERYLEMEGGKLVDRVGEVYPAGGDVKKTSKTRRVSSSHHRTESARKAFVGFPFLFPILRSNTITPPS